MARVAFNAFADDPAAANPLPAGAWVDRKAIESS